MKKLGIGPFKDMSGYATLGRNYMRSLFLVDNPEDWSLANVRYDSGSLSPIDPTLKEAMHRQVSSDIETTVQIITPNEMRAAPGKRNIGICCWETDRIPPHWAIQLNSFDELIVPCKANKEAFERSGVSIPIHIVPMPVFADDYKDDVEPFEIPGVDPSEVTIYYNISQWSHKKGIDAAIRSYFLAFQNDESVLLVLKGYVGMQNQQGDAAKVAGAVQEIKQAMRLPKYPRVYITDTMMTEEGIKKLHKMGDCYLNLSRGEGWGIPPFEALLYGNELITTKNTAMEDWVNHETVAWDYAYEVDSYLDSVHNMPHPDANLYTARENWFEPVVRSGADALQAHFSAMKRNVDTDPLFEVFDPKVVGQKLKDIIDGQG
jgi:hypothetical protein